MITNLSPAMRLLATVWEHGNKDAFGRTNRTMREALTLAIASGLRFDNSDFAKMGQFRWGYWAGSEMEWIYTLAIINLNESAILAWEAHCGRTPFRGNALSLPSWNDCYLHRTHCDRQRERLCVSCYLNLEGRRWYVTGFDDDKDLIRLASYAGDHPNGTPEKLRKLSHEELKSLCPAPKKAKMKKGGDDEPA